MSSKSHKAMLWEKAVHELTKSNSLRLCGLWWSLNITKPAFMTKAKLDQKKQIEEILSSRGVKIPKNQDYWNYIKQYDIIVK